MPWPNRPVHARALVKLIRTADPAEFWDRVAPHFDAIYTGRNKTIVGKMLDRCLRKDMYQRYQWALDRAGHPHNVCDIGCGSGRFVTALASRGALVTGIDISPQMLALARSLAEQQSVSERCEFVHA